MQLTSVFRSSTTFTFGMLFMAALASAAEQRCDELGADCVCSEPFNTTSYAQNDEVWNPADSTAKQCSLEETSYPIAANPIDRIEVKTDNLALSRLPSGHQVSAFLGGRDGGNDVFWVGHGVPASQSTQRYAMRFYIYSTDDYQFKGEGQCENSKLMQIDGPVDQSVGVIHQYGFENYAFDGGSRRTGDCCWEGPPVNRPGFSNTTQNTVRGNWWRYEYIITNLSGGPSPNGIRFQMFGKNITQGSNEIAIIDTREPCPDCGPDNAGLGADDLTPPSRVDDMVANLYRQGTCDGWRGISHMMYAAWPTNQNQRIGSALEVEGVAGAIDGGEPPPPPSGAAPPLPPTSLVAE
jgi:hypothetical protein